MKTSDISLKESAETRAKKAADFLRERLGIQSVETGLVLGTGWGETLDLDAVQQVSCSDIPGFTELGLLGKIEGHSRTVLYGTLGGVPVIALKGRIHLNETPGALATNLVRLQVEMLMELGVRKLIVTSAVGSLVEEVGVHDIIVVDGFVTLFAPTMPLFSGEFVSPEDALDADLMGLAYRIGQELYDDSESQVDLGGHVMVRGPFFEGRKYDKAYLAGTGASVVGMSALPEATVAALYPDARVLCLGFVTNSAFEEHSHEANQERAHESEKCLGTFLEQIVIETQDL